MPRPQAFCWTKYGAEAGQEVESIVARKEAERTTNGGTFLWGIGNSIRPAMAALLAQTDEPEVLFSPMLSRPNALDASPDRVVLWTRATGLDGTDYQLPRATVVTSRGSSKKRHFALVCESLSPLLQSEPYGAVDPRSLRNLASGSELGSSQVTCVVKEGADPGADARYTVRFHARLVFPYLVTLTTPVELSDDWRRALDYSRGWASTAVALREMMVADQSIQASLDLELASTNRFPS